jgi:hypothetical protein
VHDCENDSFHFFKFLNCYTLIIKSNVKVHTTAHVQKAEKTGGTAKPISGSCGRISGRRGG